MKKHLFLFIIAFFVCSDAKIKRPPRFFKKSYKDFIVRRKNKVTTRHMNISDAVEDAIKSGIFKPDKNRSKHSSFARLKTPERYDQQEKLLDKVYRRKPWSWWYKKRPKVFIMQFPTYFYDIYKYYPPLYYDFYEKYGYFPSGQTFEQSMAEDEPGLINNDMSHILVESESAQNVAFETY